MKKILDKVMTITADAALEAALAAVGLHLMQELISLRNRNLENLKKSK